MALLTAVEKIVPLQINRLVKSLLTLDAFVRSYSAMDQHVSLQVLCQAECFATFLTGVWSLASVHQDVPLQNTRVARIEHLITMWTFIRVDDFMLLLHLHLVADEGAGRVIILVVGQ
jgi:hypothetical protein